MKDDSIINLYVVNRLADDFEILEDYVKYETFGKCLHKLVVFPKKILIYTKLDHKGNIRYYNADTKKEIYIRSETTPMYSYETKSSPNLDLLDSCRAGRSTGIASINKELLEELNSFYNLYDFVIPIEEYLEERLGKKIENISLLKAKLFLKILNPISNKGIVLSTDPETAIMQLEKIGCRRSQSKKKQK